MNTLEFLERVRQTGALPSTSENWNDAAVLSEATEALRTRFAEEIVNTGSGYWRQQTVQVTAAGQNEYRIPPRAIVQGLQKLEVSTDNGVTWQLMKIVTLGSDGLFESADRGTPQHFSHYSDYVRVFPTPASSTTKLRFTFYLSPSKLIAAITDANEPPNIEGKVVSVIGSVVKVTGDATTYLPPANGMCDFINTTGCNEVALFDVAYLTAVSGLDGNTDITFPGGTDLTRVAVGQVVRLPDTTDHIPLARELHNGLATYTAACILQNIGDTQQADKLAMKATGDIRRILDLSIPRDKAHPQKLKPRNSYLRRHAGRSWR